ncbi:MAG: helix-turn-helix domain-containing protein [Ilumatobacter sp.]
MIEARDLLLHPIRLRIVQALAGTRLTPLQIKERLGDVPQATLYRHLNQLADNGLIEVVGERPARGSVERTYALVTGATALSDHDFSDATPDEHFRYFATFLGTLLDSYAAYLNAGEPALGDDRVGYRQVPLWLTDAELDDMIEAMRSAIEEHEENEPAPGRRRRLLTTIVMPDDRV